MSNYGNTDVPPLFAVWLMPVPLLLHLGAKQLDGTGEIFGRWIESESGLIENLTVVVLVPATIFCLIAMVRFSRRAAYLCATWFALTALVCFGFAGEEASWGQHWIGWESPEYFAEKNRQGETNFHNFDIQFGRLVKTILTLAIIVGGLIWPLTKRVAVGSDIDPAKPLFTIGATMICVTSAAFVVGVRLVERFKTWFDLEWALLAVNLKELQELYIALFLLIYAWSIKIRTERLR